MKSLLLILAALSIGGLSESNGQSQSFQTLKNKFSSADDVYSFKIQGFLARTVLRLAGEHEFKRAVKNVKSIRMITIPKSAFIEKSATVNGFKKVMASDSFQSLMTVREGADEMGIYVQSSNKPSLNRYLILIENLHEVVAVELKGYIDLKQLHECEQLSPNL